MSWKEKIKKIILTSNQIQFYSNLIFQQGACKYEKYFLRLCGGKSEPNISVMYFLRVECIERVGLISQTGRCAAVFSLTKTHTPLSALLLTATKSLSSNFLWGLIAGN